MVAGTCLLLAGPALAQPAPAPPPAPAPAPAPAETLPPPEAAPEEPPAPETPPAEEAAPDEPPAEEPPAEEPPAEEAAATEPPADEPAPEAIAPEEAAPEAEPETPSYRVTEEQWQAALEQNVTVEVDGGDPLRGKLVASTEAAAVVVGDDGNVHTLQKADVAALTVAEPEPEAAAEPVPEEAAEEEPPKEDDDYSRFGVFTSHGISYTHWRTSLYRAGAAAYAGDLGVGYNWSRPWGAYLVIGGNAGARLVNRTIKGNFGHLAGMMRYRGKKRFVGMFGLALAWSKLEEPTRRVRDISVSIPLKVMATFDVAKNTHIGLGIGYEPGFFAQGRIANAISFQATLAYW